MLKNNKVEILALQPDGVITHRIEAIDIHSPTFKSIFRTILYDSLLSVIKDGKYGPKINSFELRNKIMYLVCNYCTKAGAIAKNIETDADGVFVFQWIPYLNERMSISDGIDVQGLIFLQVPVDSSRKIIDQVCDYFEHVHNAVMYDIPEEVIYDCGRSHL